MYFDRKRIPPNLIQMRMHRNFTVCVGIETSVSGLKQNNEEFWLNTYYAWSVTIFNDSFPNTYTYMYIQLKFSFVCLTCARSHDLVY